MKNPSTAVLNFAQVNVVVRDLEATRAFYRRLGVNFEDGPPEWERHHASAIMPNGLRLEFDSSEFTQQWNKGWTGRPGGAGCVLFFRVPLREEVDRLFAIATEAGCRAQHAPEDAFWGARYAIVEDPDGNSVGFMSTIDPSLRRAPPPPPA